jgi:acyl transferase domain-containing protein/acyl carrier protein
MSNSDEFIEFNGLEVAVIGMDGRFPQANNIDEFWENLKNGIESITFLNDQELVDVGEDPARVANPNYVKAWAGLAEIASFDAAFFGYTPKEAKLMDPQVRIFHECAWKALEDAGYDPYTYKGLIGCYAGASANLNWEALGYFSGQQDEVGQFEARQLFDKDYLCTRVAHKLNFKGPAVSLQTACSTSLVAIHMAVQGLISGECHMALAGGSSISHLEKQGYMYREGMILCSDGHCKSFDAKANGTIFGDAIGLVVLKRLEDAIADADYIYAVIKGSFVNNDGSRRGGYTAPNAEGQAAAIRATLQVAEVEPESIGYIETHGTGTPLGDPIEVKGLKLAFNTNQKEFCAIGSVKSSMGHLNIAAGVTGFIKTVLALKHRFIPPSLHFEIPNPDIDLINSPFYVNTRLTKWESDKYPLRAGVSSFGIGGTNAHVVLEEAPPGEESSKNTNPQLILLSANTRNSLDAAAKNLADFLKKNKNINLADVAYTLQTRRKIFPYRAALVCSHVEEAINILSHPQNEKIHEYYAEKDEIKVEEDPEKNINDLIKNPGRDIPGLPLLLDKIGQSWLQGQTIDWTSFYKNQKRHCIPLPTYAFDGQRYWIDEVDMEKLKGESRVYKKQDMQDWFYIPSWKRSPLLPENKIKTENTCNLVFADSSGLSPGLSNKLQQNPGKTITVNTGPGYREDSELSYIVNPGSEEDYEKLFGKLSAANLLPGRIIHMWNVSNDSEIHQALTLEKTRKAQNTGYYSLINIAKAIGKIMPFNKIDIIIITNNMQDVDGTEDLAPGKSTILGPVNVIPQEYNNISCRTIDIVLPGNDNYEVLVNSIYYELTHKSRHKTIAYRGTQRWVHILEPVKLSKLHDIPVLLEPNRVFLITGGLGGIGLVIAEYLAKTVQPRLIITGRSQFPPKEEWNNWLEQHDANDKISKKIKKLKSMEKIGAEVLYLQVDVSHQEEMEEKIKAAEKCFGEINGIIHSAGIIDYAGVIQRRDRKENEKVFAPKVDGTLILNDILGSRKLDFFVLCSSMSSLCAHFGQVGYSSANAFLDAFANYKTKNDKVFTISINWDQWLEVGMAVNRIENAPKGQEPNEIEEGISPEQGIEVFKRSIDHNFSNLAVSFIDFDLRRELVQFTDKTFEYEEDEKELSLLHSKPDRSNLSFNSIEKIEEKLVEIWQKLLGYEEINSNDNFFELGGNSLNALNVITKIQKELDVAVSIAEFFNRPTIESLAQFIMADREKSVYSPIESAEKKEFYPLSSAQKRLYILHQVEENISTAYNIPHALLIEGKFEKQRFENSTHKLVERHESLRTSFDVKAGKPVQIVHKEVDFNIKYHSLKTGTPGIAEEEEVKGIIKKFIKPFDIKKASLFRVELVHLGEEKHMLLFDLNHIISDAISTGILVQEFVSLYGGKELPKLRIQYKDFTGWQNQSFQWEKIKKQEDYWLNKFREDIPVLNMPTDYPRPLVRVYEGDIIRIMVNENLTTPLNKLAADTETTLFMLLLAAFNILLYNYTEQADIVVGSPISGRTHADLENVIGMFVNTLPLRNHLDEKQSFEALLKEVRRNVLEGYENQDYPLNELVVKLGIPRDTGRNPLFDILFVSEIIDIPRLEVDELKFTPYEFEHNISHMDLVFYFNEIDNNLLLMLEYSTVLFKQSSIEGILKHYVEILEQVVENREIKLEEIKITHDFLVPRTSILEENQDDFGF